MIQSTVFEMKSVYEPEKLCCDRDHHKNFMGGAHLLNIFIICKQIACKLLLYAHTEDIYHPNSAFLNGIGGILKCISLKLGIFKSLLSASELKSYILFLNFRVL
jgi:hypothetical protein